MMTVTTTVMSFKETELVRVFKMSMHEIIQHFSVQLGNLVDV